ncbi:hypothetical protein GCM10023235_38350 [Kitasatospora terrestris]|uniref:Uncharacterized protein n=1 Tax=Kitasatospora terrestris TaxID=258051 RepID=A0ABP9DRY1_9ACTN
MPRKSAGGAGLPPARAPPPVCAPAGALAVVGRARKGRKAKAGAETDKVQLPTRTAEDGEEGRGQNQPHRGRGGRLRGFTHLPGPGPASSKNGGPLGQIAVRPKEP